jgi:hypothetical protein
MIIISDYIGYFQHLAKRHKDIMSFYIMDINEVLTSLRSDVRYPALILTSLTGEISGPNIDNNIDRFYGGFLILDHLDSPDDFSSEMIILGEMKQIGVDIISRMIYDATKACRWKEGDVEFEPYMVLKGFRPPSVKYEMIGPVFDNDFGYMFTFEITDSVDLDYDVSRWLDNEEMAEKISGMFGV